MATVFFSKAAGQVQSLPDPSLPANISLRLEGWGGFIGFKSIVTRVTVAAKGNFQFLHTLGGQVFIYVFGDRIGQLSLTGIAFDSICGDPAGVLGVENIFNYYAQNRVANRRAPIRITIGATTSLRAYLLDVMADVADTKSRVWQFTLVMALVPRDQERPKGNGGEAVGNGGGGQEGDAVAINAEDGSGSGSFFSTEGGSTEFTFGDSDYEGYTPDAGGNVSDVTLKSNLTATGFAAAATGPKTSLVLPFA